MPFIQEDCRRMRSRKYFAYRIQIFANSILGYICTLSALPRDKINPFLPTVPTFAVRETDVSRTANVGTVGMNGLIQTELQL